MFTSNNLFAQDRTEHVLCAGGTKILSSPLADNPDYCYMWTPEYALVDPDDQHNREVEVGPEVTTLFKLKITNNINGKLIYEAENIVYVVEGISIDLLRQEKEECFHGEELFFRAKLEGQQLETALDEPFNVEFSIADFSQSLLLPYDYSALNTFYFLNYTTDRIFLDPDHEHLLRVKARIIDDNGSICFESELEINVIQFYITSFNQRKNNKDWKVVVAPTGNKQTVPFDNHSKIIHDVKTPQYCTDFEWAMENPWLLEGSSINQKSGNELFINNSSMPTATSWDLFGEKRGNVMVKCTDYLGVERMLNSAKFGPGSSTSSELMSPPKLVEVFFHKWDDNPEQKLGYTGQLGGIRTIYPNWFFYWKEIVQQDDNIALNIGKNLYYATDFSLSDPNDKSGNPISCTGVKGRVLAASILNYPNKPNNSHTVICSSCGQTNKEDLPSIPNKCKGRDRTYPKVPWGTGIESFYSVVYHESYHYTIYDKIWFGHSYYDNFDSSLDIDKDPIDLSLSGDRYRDKWEDIKGSGPGNDQGWWLDGKLIDHDGYHCWDEWEARFNQKNNIDHSRFNDNDWSYDIDGTYQGKNW